MGMDHVDRCLGLMSALAPRTVVTPRSVLKLGLSGLGEGGRIALIASLRGVGASNGGAGSDGVEALIIAFG